MPEFWEKPAEKLGKVLAAFLEGLPLPKTSYFAKVRCKALSINKILSSVQKLSFTSRIRIRPIFRSTIPSKMDNPDLSGSAFEVPSGIDAFIRLKKVN
jgi:hypothetical protein